MAPRVEKPIVPETLESIKAAEKELITQLSALREQREKITEQGDGFIEQVDLVKVNSWSARNTEIEGAYESFMDKLEVVFPATLLAAMSTVMGSMIIKGQDNRLLDPLSYDYDQLGDKIATLGVAGGAFGLAALGVVAISAKLNKLFQKQKNINPLNV